MTFSLPTLLSRSPRTKSAPRYVNHMQCMKRRKTHFRRWNPSLDDLRTRVLSCPLREAASVISLMIWRGAWRNCQPTPLMPRACLKWPLAYTTGRLWSITMPDGRGWPGRGTMRERKRNGRHCCLYSPMGRMRMLVHLAWPARCFRIWTRFATPMRSSESRAISMPAIAIR